MRDINKHQIFVVFTIILVLSMTIYSNGHFRDLFSYYEHTGDKAYDQNDDGWSVDLDAPFEMEDEFDLMLENIDEYEYLANSVIVVNQGTIVRERYYNDFSYSTQFNTYSVAISADSRYIVVGSNEGIYLFFNEEVRYLMCQHGQTKLADDGCNQCICNNGDWVCTDVDCGKEEATSPGDVNQTAECEDVSEDSMLPSVSLIPALISIGLIAILRRK